MRPYMSVSAESLVCLILLVLRVAVGRPPTLKQHRRWRHEEAILTLFVSSSQTNYIACWCVRSRLSHYYVSWKCLKNSIQTAMILETFGRAHIASVGVFSVLASYVHIYTKHLHSVSPIAVSCRNRDLKKKKHNYNGCIYFK